MMMMQCDHLVTPSTLPILRTDQSVVYMTDSQVRLLSRVLPTPTSLVLQKVYKYRMSSVNHTIRPVTRQQFDWRQKVF